MTEVTVARRVDIVERDTREHSRILTGIITDAQSTETRMSVVEKWMTQHDILKAREDEQTNQLRAAVSSIQKSASRIQWTILTAIVLAVVAFVVRGGLGIPSI